jgi:hypothetical protein
MARSGVEADRDVMTSEHSIHFCGEHGRAMCGVVETRHLSRLESAVTCLECRAFMALKALERNLTERRLAATIARLSSQRS